MADSKRGAKNRYERDVKPYLEEINRKVRQGVTEAAIAQALGISVATLSNYKNKYPEFKDALSKNKGVEVLQQLVNAGIKAGTGYFENNETTTVIIDDNGKPSKKQKVVNKVWYPPNPALNKFYVLNFGKNEGYNSEPLDYELKKARQELDEAIRKAENWDIDLDDK
jgi:transcriptional regulator with XRE-family HTH domain